MLFEVALLKKPTPNEEDAGQLEELLVAPEPIIAQNDHSAGAKSIMKHKDKIADIFDRVEVVIRPFG